MAYSFAAGDEVGQAGFKFERGSTEFFAVTLILTNHPQTIWEGLRRLRSELGLSSATEFKFHSTPHQFRLTFLDRAKGWPMAVRSLYVNKRLLPADFRGLDSWKFYGYFVAQLLGRLPREELGQTTLVLDEFGPPRSTLRAVREQLRLLRLWGGKAGPIKRITFRRSRSEATIQAADMCGGSIYRWVTQADDTYYRRIQSKALIWEYRSPE